MKQKDWFRRTTWTKQDNQDFFSRLKRARENNRVQYLLIQASCLEDTGNQKYIVGALDLIEIAINQYPYPIYLERAYQQKANCLERVGKLDDALIAYRNAFIARRNKPNIRTDAPLKFGMYAVRHNRHDLYREVLSVFQELVNRNDISFPVEHFMFYSTTAIIADHFHEKEKARQCAQKALDAESKTYSGLVRHPTVGLVKRPDKEIENKLQRILK